VVKPVSPPRGSLFLSFPFYLSLSKYLVFLILFLSCLGDTHRLQLGEAAFARLGTSFRFVLLGVEAQISYT